MNNNICGNCGNFRPKPNESFFNCTSAKHSGLSYGMQVRPDTRACDAFTFFYAPSQSAQDQPAENIQVTEDSEPVGLCTMGQKSLVASVSVAIILVSWLLYTCAQS